jgi:hypothetical protein
VDGTVLGHGGDRDGGGGGGVVSMTEESDGGECQADGVVPGCGDGGRGGQDGDEVEEGTRNFGSLTTSKSKSSD